MIQSAVDQKRPIRVLIVDDVRDNRELLQVMLEWEGFVTLMAGSGEEALTRVASDAPDVVLLDLGLPGLNGCDVTTQLKAADATKRIPVVIISGRDDDATKRRLLAAGAADFLVKPISRADLCQRVRDALGLAAAAPAAAPRSPTQRPIALTAPQLAELELQRAAALKDAS